MVCVSVVCNLFSTKTESSNQTYLDDAKAQLTEYSDNYNYTKFEFMNSLFEKANVIASVITENTSAETNALLVKNLGINSFVMTDADGKIIASSDDKKVGTNFLDDETTKQFKANLKGMKVKSISEPTAVEGEDGVYNLMACVARTEGGIVIIDTNTIDGTTYSLSSMPSGEYTIISGQAATESGFNMIYGVVIPCAAGVVMIIISAIILSLGTTKKKEIE